MKSFMLMPYDFFWRVHRLLFGMASSIKMFKFFTSLLEKQTTIFKLYLYFSTVQILNTVIEIYMF